VAGFTCPPPPPGMACSDGQLMLGVPCLFGCCGLKQHEQSGGIRQKLPLQPLQCRLISHPPPPPHTHTHTPLCAPEQQSHSSSPGMALYLMCAAMGSSLCMVFFGCSGVARGLCLPDIVAIFGPTGLKTTLVPGQKHRCGVLFLIPIRGLCLVATAKGQWMNQSACCWCDQHGN